MHLLLLIRMWNARKCSIQYKKIFLCICPDLDYQEALITFNILPLPYYFQLLDLISFHDADFTEHFRQFLNTTQPRL